MAVYLGKKLVLANGVGGTSLANGHASTHAPGGGDTLSPESIGAARADHTHSGYAPKPVVMSITLPQSGWVQEGETYTQKVTVSGMTAATLALSGPASNSVTPYIGANIRCSVQGENTLTYAADKVPTADVEINLVSWGEV